MYSDRNLVSHRQLRRLIGYMTRRREGSPTDAPSDGERFHDEVQALYGASPDRQGCVVTGVQCVGGCNRSCTIGLAAPGRPSYLFVALPPTNDAAAESLALAIQYRNGADGVLEDRNRPLSFRRGILAKIPAALLS